MKRQAAPRSRYLSVALAHVDLRRGGRRVLRDLNWRIHPGQRWVLQGANGAGKTQLLKLIAGDVWPQPRPETRRIYCWRSERSSEPMGVKEEIAYLGAERQDRYEHYEWNHRVATIVGTGAERSDIPLRKLTAAEQTHVARVLQRLGIAALAGRRCCCLMNRSTGSTHRIVHACSPPSPRWPARNYRGFSRRIVPKKCPRARRTWRYSSVVPCAPGGGGRGLQRVRSGRRGRGAPQIQHLTTGKNC